MPKTDENSTQPPSRVPDFTTTALSSISGFVRAEGIGASGLVSGALVQYGSKSTLTDEFGYFEIKDANVIKEAAQLTVTKDEHEIVYKTFQVTDGQSIFTRICLTRFSAGVFNAGAGGSLSFNGSGPTITISSNTLVNESSNTPYSDFIRGVLSFRTNRDESFDENLPGNLLGIDSSGKLKLLTIHDYGNVFLKGMNGEKLQLAAGAKATLKFYLSTPEGGANPPSIQLWHYDPAKGFWQQKGRVQVVSGYEVNFQVSELGYFALATADDYVKVSGKLVDKSDKPIPYTGVFLVPKPTEQHRSVWYYTNEQGYFSGYVKESSQQLVQVNAGCTPAIFSKGFTTEKSNVSLGSLVLTDERVITIKATLKGCGGTKVSNGYIQFVDQVRHKANSEGILEFNTVVCNFTYPGIAMYAVEIPTAQKSDMLFPTVAPGYNDLGNLSVCGTHSIIRFSCKLVDNTGGPIPDLPVRITPLNDPSAVFKSKSNADGLVSDFIYTNRDFRLSVYGSLQCNTPLFTTNFSTVNRDTSFGNLTMPTLTTATITGTVVDCNNNPMKSGYVVVYKDEKAYQAQLNTAGVYSITLPVCNSGAAEIMLVTSFSAADLLPGTTIPASIIPGLNTISPNGCYSLPGTKEYVSYVIDNTRYGSYIVPQDSIKQEHDGNTTQSHILVHRRTMYGAIYTASLSFHTNGIAVGSNQALEGIYIGEIDASQSGPATVSITEYGTVGGYIAGTIQTNVTDQNFRNYALKLSFRVKRIF